MCAKGLSKKLKTSYFLTKCILFFQDIKEDHVKLTIMGADISQFKQADLVKHIPDLAKIDEFGNGEGGGKKFQVSKSQSPSFAHFSDYSMFPDRFNGKSSPRAILGKVIKIQSMSNK